MFETALTLLSGTLLYAGAHHLYLGARRASTQPHLQLAAMYLLLAGFVLASAITYQSQDIGSQVRLARLSMTLGILLWIALIWYVAFYTRSKPLLLLDLLTAAWAIFLIRNISAPHGLLYADIAPTALYASTSGWWTAVKFTMLASLLFCFSAGLRMFRRGNRQAALALVSGLLILLAASLADHVLNTPVIHALYLAPFGFIGFLLVNSLYPILLDYRERRKAIQAPVIYSLPYNPEQTWFDTRLAYLQSPPGEKFEVTVTPPPESTVATDRETLPSSAFLPEKAVDVAVIEPETKAGSSETGKQTPWQEHQTPMSKRSQSSLNTVSDNLIDIAVYATMVLNRCKRGDADTQALEVLCKKIRTKAIKTRRVANRLSRPN